MYKVLRKYNRKLLAVFSVGLMVAFIVPSAYKYGRGDNMALGTIGGNQKLYRADLVNGRGEWEFLKRHVMVLQMLPPEYRAARQNQSPYDWAPIILQLGPAATQIERNAELYPLLRIEALNMGIRINPERIDQLLKSEEVQLVDVDSEDPRQLQNLRQALTGYLLIQEAFQRAQSVIKISAPYQQRELAQRWQEIKLDLVEVSAADFAAKVPAPTAQQLKEQFERFADMAPGQSDAARNPFGFGYRYPDRVKLQTLAVRREDVKKAVRESRSAHRWEVDAAAYYVQHPEEFTASTQPASGSEMTLGPTSVPASAPSTAPTTRPFAQASEQIIEKLQKPLIDRLQRDIFDRITTLLATDWISFSRQSATSAPATAPSSSLGVAYGSYDYFKALADLMQSQFHVRPALVDEPQWRSAQELENFGDISGAVAGNIPFAIYATLQDHPNALKPLQPSQPLRDQAGNVYLYRTTAFDPAHRPASLDLVEKQVAQDVQRQAAYQLARAYADKLLEQARQSSLADAAKSDGKKVITTGLFSGRAGGAVPMYPLPPETTPLFVQQAFDLMNHMTSSATTGPTTAPAATAPATTTPTITAATAPAAHAATLGLIELPTADRLAVAQVAQVQPYYDWQTLPQAQLGVRRMVDGQFSSLLLRDWFNYQNVVKRLDYQPTGDGRGKGPDEPQEQQGPPPPLF